MKYLITGGTGFIGSSFIKHNTGSKNSFIMLSRSSACDTGNSNIIQIMKKLTILLILQVSQLMLGGQIKTKKI